MKVAYFLVVAGLVALASCTKNNRDNNCAGNATVTVNTEQECPVATANGVNAIAGGFQSVELTFGLTPPATLSIEPLNDLVEETTYTQLNGAALTRADLQRTDRLSVIVTNIDQTLRTISGTFSFEGVTSTSAGSETIEYEGSFTAVSIN